MSVGRAADTATRALVSIWSKEFVDAKIVSFG